MSSGGERWGAKEDDERKEHSSCIGGGFGQSLNHAALLPPSRTRLIFHGQSASTWLWLGFVFTTLVNVICYRGIAALAAPIYGEKGELLDGGNDLSMGGFCAYYHDFLYVTCAVQIGASFFDWFWYVYLVVPGYGLYKLGEKVVVPWIKTGFDSAPEPVMDEETKKKMERAQQRAQRRAMKWR